MECPEPLERGRNFRLLREEELPQLLDFLTGYLPQSLKFHQTVLTFIKNKVWNFHFYVATEWPKVPICLHFPGMTLSPHGLLYESFGVFCPTENFDKLHLLSEENILIDWNKPLYINFIHCDIAEKLFCLYGNCGTIDRVLGDVWAYEQIENRLLDDTRISTDNDDYDDVKVLPLTAEHAEGIHELYPANDMECHELFLRLIKIFPAAGVFVGDDLAAWMIQSYYGAMFSMQTKPEYRRKGYGTRLARYLTKLVSDRGYIPFVVIRPENEASQSLYNKLEFKKLYQTVRATFTPRRYRNVEGEEEEKQEAEKDEVVNNEEELLTKENLANAIIKLQITQRVIDGFQQLQDDESIVVAESGDEDANDTILDPLDSPKDKDEIAKNDVENDNKDECLESIQEQQEDKTESQDSNEDDGGTNQTED